MKCNYIIAHMCTWYVILSSLINVVWRWVIMWIHIKLKEIDVALSMSHNTEDYSWKMEGGESIVEHGWKTFT